MRENQLVDVRSPSEYRKGHIPHAINIPLFSDEERALVGTTYKKDGHEKAFVLGLEVVGPKLATLFRELKKLGAVTIYCWRGGMRSEWVARLIDAPRLPGGYKAWRKKGLDLLRVPRRLIILGGFTGSGKTDILRGLEGEQVLDLEGLANHRGSAFGDIGEQPTQEHFENLIAWQLEQFDERPIWIEDESRRIGKLEIPNALLEQMGRAPLVVMDRPQEERVDRLVKEYTSHERVIAGIESIKKRLGGERAKQAIAALSHDPHETARLLLHYYDRTYQFCLEKREKEIYPIRGKKLDQREWIKKILTISKEKALLST